MARLSNNLLSRLPAWQNLRAWRSGRQSFDALVLDSTAISEYTRTLQPRVADADGVVHGICPYCAVGCSQLIYVKDGKVIDIEGNPRSLARQRRHARRARPLRGLW